MQKLLLLTLVALSANALPSLSSLTQDSDAEAVSEFLRELYEEDQAVRADWGTGSKTPEEMGEIHRSDRERREEILAVLADGMLSTGDDHFHAAMILQHGGAPEDYLLSHMLATIGGFQGHETSRWLAAAALDRFLQSVDRPQVFGTQYLAGPSGKWTQDPIDGALIPDAVRKRYGVPGLVAAAERLKQFDNR